MKYFLTLIAIFLLSAGCSQGGGGGGGGTNPSGNNPPGPGAPKEVVPFEKAVVGSWLSECAKPNQSRDLLVVKDNGQGFRQELLFDTEDCTGIVSATSEKEAFTYKLGAEKSGARAVEVTNSAGTFPFEASIDNGKLSLKGLGRTAMYLKVDAPEGLHPGDPLPAPVEAVAPSIPSLPELPTAPGQPQPPPGGGEGSAAFNAAVKGTWEMQCALVRDPETNDQLGSQITVLEIGDGKAVQWGRLYLEVANCSGEWSRIHSLDFDYTVKSFTGGVAELDIRITRGVPNPQPQQARVSVFGNSLSLQQATGTQQYWKVR